MEAYNTVTPDFGLHVVLLDFICRRQQIICLSGVQPGLLVMKPIAMTPISSYSFYRPFQPKDRHSE